VTVFRGPQVGPERFGGVGGSAGPTAGRAAVLGSPIAHSLSPALHRAAYAALGLDDWSYEVVELTEEQFGDWFAALGPEWRGLSLTMPLKRVVFGRLAEVSPLARTVGAVNTVTWDDARRPVGENTDVHGMVEALRSAGVTSASAAGSGSGSGSGSSSAGSGPSVVLGGGATACSALAALYELGAREVRVQVRSAARARAVTEVAGRLGLAIELVELTDFAGPQAHQAALAAPVLVSTLPADAAADWAAGLPAGPAAGRPAGVLLDVAYHPRPTPAARAWTEAGGVAVDGFEMLLHQAAEQVTLMTGRPAPLAAMRAAGLAALASRG
jgi:shikimate dehydrogenase